MRPLIAVLLLTLISACFAADKKAAPDPTAARIAKIAATTAQMHDELVARRRDFHMHPELSNREQTTAAVVAEELKKIGFTDIRTGVGKYGVVATLKGGKPGAVVAVRADMDALPIQEVNDVPYKSQVPNVKHACGHDAHTTIELGVAKVLYGMRDQIPGTVKFIFQPAEEGAPEGEEGGAAFMIKQGALEDPKPDAIFGLHTSPQVEVGKVQYRPGSFMASSDGFDIVVKGKQSHGAMPHLGIDAVVVSAQIIQTLQTIPSRRIRALDPVVLTVGKIDGGVRRNVVAQVVHMEGTLRTLGKTTREEVRALMAKLITQVATANDATATLTWSEHVYPLTYNDPTVTEEVLPTMQRVLGKENVILSDPQMVSEDFSAYQQQVPGMFYYLGIRNEARGITAGWHTPDFDIDERALDVGVNVMSNIVLDYLDRHAKAGATSSAGK